MSLCGKAFSAFARRINQIATQAWTGKTLDNVPLSLNIRSWFSEQQPSFMGTQRQGAEWAKKFVKRHHPFIRRDHIDEFRLLNPNIRDDERVAMEIREGLSGHCEPIEPRRSLAVHLRRLDLVSTNDLDPQAVWALNQRHDRCGICPVHSTLRILAGRSLRHSLPRLKEVDTELSASRAVSYQHEGLLYGEGREVTECPREVGISLHQMTFPTLKKAMSMAKRGGQKLVSLGNGFYCMNGTADCEFRGGCSVSVLQSGMMCENMLGRS
ncbi:hypothetical protein AB9K28_03175 [Enterobacter asburiae]